MNRASTSRAEDKAAAEAYRAQQEAPPVPAPQAPPSGGGGDDVIAKLKQLGDLHASGILSDEEFGAAKAKLLA
jgi:hypothetical protein